MNEQHSLYLQYHDWGALEQGTEPPIAPRALEQWLPTAPGVCSQCVFTTHCCVCALGWVNCRAPISSMGHHTWQYITYIFCYSIYPSIQPSICHSVILFIHPSIHCSVILLIHPSIVQLFYLSIHPSIVLLFYLFTHLSTQPSIVQLFYLSIHPSIHPSFRSLNCVFYAAQHLI